MKKVRKVAIAVMVLFAFGLVNVNHSNEVDASTKMYCKNTSKTRVCRDTKSSKVWTKQVTTYYSNSKKTTKYRTKQVTFLKNSKKLTTKKVYTWFHSGGTKVSKEEVYTDYKYINNKWTYKSATIVYLDKNYKKFNPDYYTKELVTSRDDTGRIRYKITRPSKNKDRQKIVYDRNGRRIETYVYKNGKWHLQWKRAATTVVTPVAPVEPVITNPSSNNFAVEYYHSATRKVYDYSACEAMPVNSFNTAEANAYALCLINEVRYNNDVPVYAYERVLQNYANTRSYEITKLFDHTRPNGEMFNVEWANNQQEKYKVVLTGENIAKCSSKSQNTIYFYKDGIRMLHDLWVESPDHFNNMISKNHKSVTTSIYASSNGVINGVQLFSQSY